METLWEWKKGHRIVYRYNGTWNIITRFKYIRKRCLRNILVEACNIKYPKIFIIQKINKYNEEG